MSEEKENNETQAGWKDILNSKISLLIVGFVLTTILGGMLNDRIQSARWEKETRFKVFQNQLTEGDSVQSDVLSATGELRRQMNTARMLANDTKFDQDAVGIDENGAATADFVPDPSLIEARAYFDNVLTPKYLEWTQSLHRTKNKVALIFGEDAAQTLLSRADNVLHLDICSVLVRDEDSGLNEDCAERRKTELNGLRGDGDARKPESIHHAFRVSRFLIKRAIWCKDPREQFPSKAEKCDQPAMLRFIMNWRYNLTGTAHDALSDHFLAEMLTLNAAVR